MAKVPEKYKVPEKVPLVNIDEKGFQGGRQKFRLVSGKLSRKESLPEILEFLKDFLLPDILVWIIQGSLEGSWGWKCTCYEVLT